MILVESEKSSGTFWLYILFYTFFHRFSDFRIKKYSNFQVTKSFSSFFFLHHKNFNNFNWIGKIERNVVVVFSVLYVFPIFIQRNIQFSGNSPWDFVAFFSKIEDEKRHDRGSSHSIRIFHETLRKWNALEKRLSSGLAVDRSSNFRLGDHRISPGNGTLSSQAGLRCSGW